MLNVEKLHILIEDSTLDGVDCRSASAAKGNGASIEVDTGIFLLGLIHRLQPKVAIETGTNFGYCASFIGLALESIALDYPHLRGHLWTVDVDRYEGRPEALWETLGVSNYITHVISDALTAPLPPRPAQFLMLDSDHDGDFVYNEFHHFLPILDEKRCTIAVHDTRLDARLAPGIRRILASEELKSKYRHIGHFPMRNLRGLDLMLLSNEEL